MDYVLERVKAIAPRVPFPYVEVREMVLAGLTDEEIELAATLGLSEKVYDAFGEGRWNQLEIYSFSVMQLKSEKLFETFNKITDVWARKRGWTYYWLYHRCVSSLVWSLIRWITKIRNTKAADERSGEG